MLEVTVAEILLGNSQLAVSLVRPSGEILYENRLARDLMGRAASPASSIVDSLTMPLAWREILEKLGQSGNLEDEPVLLQTLHGDAELCYLTVVPQYDADGGREALLCMWAVRRKALSSASQATDTGTLSEYTRELEELLEHRTYQNLLAAEQNESARDAMDLLTTGVLIAARDGGLLYRNRAVADDYGVKPANYLQPTVQHILESAAVDAFREVVATGLRQCVIGHDPGGIPAAMEFLPLVRAGQVQKVVIQFSRPVESERAVHEALSLNDLEPGMILGKSLFDENGQLLLRSGYTLDREILHALAATGRTVIYIFEEGTEEIIPEDLISEENRSRASHAFRQTVERVADAATFRADIPPERLRVVIERGAEFRNVVDVDRVTADMTSIVDEIMDSSAQVLNQTLIKSCTGYNTEHAVDTALVALLIARRLSFSRRELVELGAAAFLHDLGKLAMPALLAKPPAEFTEEEAFLMREHPVFGQQLLANSSDRLFMARTAILHHHERQDGLGYPLGLNGENRRPALNGQDTARLIFPFAEIIAVADAYDNLISPRLGAPHTPEHAIRELMKQARSAFNVEVTALLAEVIAVFPAGAMVRIAECSTKMLEGAVGAVMRPSSERPHQPLIVLLRNARGHKITPRTVDLSAEQYAHLELVC